MEKPYGVEADKRVGVGLGSEVLDEKVTNII